MHGELNSSTAARITFMRVLQPYRGVWIRAVDTACRSGVVLACDITTWLLDAARERRSNLSPSDADDLIGAIVGAGDLVKLGLGLYAPTQSAREYGPSVGTRINK
jgi:hypothetical protein